MKTTLATVLLAASFAGAAYSQTVAGKWMAEAPGGTATGLELTAAGTNVGGTIILIRGPQAIPLPIAEGSVTSNTLKFSVQMGPQRVEFTGERTANEIRFRTTPSDPANPPLVFRPVTAFPAAVAQGLSAATLPTTAPAGWRAFNRSAQSVDEGTRKVVRVDTRPNDGVVWQVGSDFREGTIELELRGTNAPQLSFVGIAFRGADNTNYDAVYFRPFNFKAPDPARQRAVQYVSHPDFPWMKLRTDSPGKYEQAVSPVPDPDGWFRARIVIAGDQITVFVNDASAPTLTVTALSKRANGMVGFWVGNNSGGDFANLKLTPK